jgi:threonine dehydratase
MFTLAELEEAAAIVYRAMPPTPQYRWPLLDKRCGARVWVKHENHTPVGAFKIRGGLVYFDALVTHGKKPSGVVGATRGNHGQSVGRSPRKQRLQERGDARARRGARRRGT